LRSIPRRSNEGKVRRGKREEGGKREGRGRREVLSELFGFSLIVEKYPTKEQRGR
jgi:hypothetical protein